ncbi:MAG: hypothetical protein KGJ86_06145, partial [Chloroflexota bacterium]|nr:hypothetical protein [Chloroflexota bacterium]
MRQALLTPREWFADNAIRRTGSDPTAETNQRHTMFRQSGFFDFLLTFRGSLSGCVSVDAVARMVFWDLR